jgi:RimJ/RimL family protein N-acetyltransferase
VSALSKRAAAAAAAQRRFGRGELPSGDVAWLQFEPLPALGRAAVPLTVGRLQLKSARQPLDTPRLTLEPLAESHADALLALYQEPAVSRFLITRPRSRQEFRELLNLALAFGESHGMWAVLPRGERTLIGRVGFFAFGESGRPELAFLLSSSAWGRGYATEACQAALHHAFVHHRWEEVVAVVRPANSAAIRVLRKLGFSPEGEVLLKGEHAVLFHTACPPADRLQLSESGDRAAGVRKGDLLRSTRRRLSEMRPSERMNAA